ncbi:uncharacterized protein LOC124438427 isoform X2 [Xenia sp. Carnegie-2017]|uniref:uncharacterized protein LOC124438427 isoform X2 n=1 Tax=Xenia sp. Carnegie-2017 TaxID=2897299 RepID=UPI001F0440E4|nr:uncharacterized protein LOC124438427 isoform X2 [Xenia sp. Carnegie-2017]
MESSDKSSLDSDKKSTSYSDLPVALSFLKRGNCSIDNRDYETAIELYKKCLKGAEEKSVKMMAHFSLGNAYILSDKMEEGLNCFNECLNFSSKVDSKYFQHEVYFGLESVRSTNNRLDDGIKKEEIDSLCHVALGGLNKLSRNYEQSLEHYKKGFSLIESLYKQEIQLSQQENPQHRQKKVGGINVSKDFIDHNIKNLSIITSTGIMNGVLIVYWELAELFDKLEQWDDATRIYEIYLEIVRKDEDIEKQTNVVQRLIQIYEKDERYALKESMVLNLQKLDEKKKNKELQFQEWECIDESKKHKELLLKLIDNGRDPKVKVEHVNDVRVIFSEEFCIGKGSDGTLVYLGLAKNGYGKAVKRIRKDNCTNIADHEKKILNKKNAKESKHVVNYCSLVEDAGEYVYLVLDLCEESLEDFVQSNELANLVESLPKILEQILTGLFDLHKGSDPILHLDLKPCNVLRDAHGKFLLADFGISHILKKGLKTYRATSRKGTEHWIAPESYCEDEDSFDKGRYKRESDIMNAGMVAYYVATKGKHAFGSLEFRLHNMLNGNPVGLDEINNVELKDLLTWMLQLKPELRPSANEALKHPYLLSNNDKFDLLCDVRSQLDTEIPNLNHPLYEDVRELVNGLENWKDRVDFKTSNNLRKEDYESTWLGCLKFLQNFHQHWQDESCPHLSQMEGNYKEYFIQVFPELPLLVNRIVRLCDWKSILDREENFKKLQFQKWKCIDESKKHKDLLLKLIDVGRDPDVTVEYVNDVRVVFSEEFCIGKGSDGTRVYLGLAKNGYGKAVKRIPQDTSIKVKPEEKKVFDEINAKNSTYVVNTVLEKIGKEYVCFILDLCEESLESFVLSESNELANLLELLPKILRHILKGLADLHSVPRPILHRDLKPSNVLRDAHGNFLIADFRMSRILINEGTLRSGCKKGTEFWIAPESYCEDDESLNKARYKKESDVMSAGMVAYYVVTKGKHPFGSMKYRLYNMLRGNPVGLKEINNVELKDLLTWMLQLKPELRPSANEALKHPYLQSNNDKLDLLCNVTYPLDTEIPNLNHPLYEDVREQVNRLKNWKDRLDFKTSNNVKKEDYESTWLGCLKFIQDFHQDNKPRLQLSQSDDNYKEYLLQVFPELPLLVNRIVRLQDWKSRSVVGKHFTSVTKSQVWQVKDMNRFRRFLVLGNCTSTFYVNEKSLGLEHEQVLSNLMEAGRGVEVVNEIEKYSIEGRTPRQQAIVFSLAVCARKGDLATKRQAYNALPKICQIPTHLFMFIKFCKYLSQSGCGWSRAHKNAIKRWYKEKDPWKLAMDITKYQKREGWSHRDVVRLMHLKPEGIDVSDELFVIMKYVVCGWQKLFKYFFPEDKTTPSRPIGENGSKMLVFLRAVEEVKTLQEETRVVELINEHNLVREHIPTHFLNSKEVWDALLKKMPMTAMIRNLNKMTSIGLLAEGSPRVKEVCDKLRDEDLLMNARIHPFNMLLALATYQSGESENVSLELKANEEIIKVLEEAFYLSFKTVEPTGKRYMLAMDVSGSMQSSRCVGSSPVRSHMASAAMAMMTARTEQHCKVVAFSHEIVLIGISSSMKLNEILNVINEIPKGGRDCAQPMLYAIDKNLKIDVFIVYTDSEPCHGKVHPREALKQYRHQSGIDDAKLIVVAMTSNGFTIADPDDSGMLDIVGFDSTAPQVMREFILGNF